MNGNAYRIGMDPDDRYFLPYHYLDLASGKADEQRLLLLFEYLNRLDIVKSLLDLSMIRSILDAGCGDGRFLYELKNIIAMRVGIDWSDRALAFARIFNPLAEFVQGDLMTFKYRSRFDAIVMIEVLEHFTPLSAQIILENLSNHLVVGGKFIITVPSINQKVHGDHCRHFDEETLRETLETHFRVIKLFGHTRSQGWRIKLWWKYRRVCTWLYPLRLHIGGVMQLLERLNEVYAARYAIGKPDECNGIIAICGILE